MNKVLIAAGILIAGAGFARGQDTQSVETRFHRVFLRNGNVVDGQLVSMTDKGVTLSVRGGEFKVHADQVDRVEVVKVRSIVEKPRVAAIAAPKSVLKAVRPVPSIDPAIKVRVDKILGQMAVVTASERDLLTRELSRRPGIGAYLASQMEQMKDEMLPYVGRALWELQESESAPYVAAALDSDRPAVVSQAVLLSARLDSQSSVSQIRRFLGDSRPRVRAATIDALRVAADERSLPDMVGMIGASEDVVRASAINASLEMGRKFGRMDLVAEALRDAIERARGAVLGDLIEAAGRSGSAALGEPVARGLQDGDGAIRARSAAALAQLKVTSTLTAINHRLTVEDHIPAQIQLIRAAGAFRSAKSVDALIYLLRSTDEDVVKESAKVLGQITRQNFGLGYAEWISWWEQVRAR